MFGRYVEVGEKRVLVFCTPQTPLSEVCQRAARQLAREEENELKGSEYYQLYRKHVCAPGEQTK